MSSTIYKTGGPLTENDINIYIERKADKELIEHIKQMNYVMCIQPRQQGKTSLIFHLMDNPALKKYVFIYINMNILNESNSTETYKIIGQEIKLKLNDLIKNDQTLKIPETSYEWFLFLRKISLLAQNNDKRIVIFLDEIGAVLFSGSNDFFSILHNTFTSRKVESNFNHLTFILVGAFNPSKLIENECVSPFNVAERIHLNDFSQEQVNDLVKKGGKWNDDQSKSISEQIYSWTGGQPYLTQVICKYIQIDISVNKIESYIEKLLQEDQNHIPHILKNYNRDERLKDYMQQILAGEKIKFYPTQNVLQHELVLLGLIKADNAGNCIIRNRIYTKIFHDEYPQHFPPSEGKYIDFEVHITQDGMIRVKSKQGERQAKIDITLPNIISLTLRSIENNQTDAIVLKDFGRQLYKMLFPPKIFAHLKETEAVAPGHKIRIRLHIEPDSLARIPWEFTYDNERGNYLSINPKTIISRYLNLPAPKSKIRLKKNKLNLLLIISNPIDQIRLDPDEWEYKITKALAVPIKKNLISITPITYATRKKIAETLLEQQPDIIQFVGHGIYLNNQGFLALVDNKTGGTWQVTDELFAAIFLTSNNRLGLVSLATCESAKSDSPQGFLGIAPKIVQKGVPAVVAMQYCIKVKSALLFIEEFYQAIAARKPVDWAVHYARNQVFQEFGLDNREFATPVLYMRAKDGKIF